MERKMKEKKVTTVVAKTMKSKSIFSNKDFFQTKNLI